MAANIIRNRLNLLMVLLLLGLGVVPASRTSAEEGTFNKGGRSPHDRRHEQVGTWTCSGVTTAPYGTERPYYGVLQNRWTSDGLLLLHFEEQHPVTETPLIEDQYWGYDEVSKRHSRTLTANDGSHAHIRSYGWQKDRLPWTGTFTAGGLSYPFEETLERLSANRYRWYGIVEHEGSTLVRYEMTCTRDK